MKQYDEQVRSEARKELFASGHHDGPECLICRSWRKPCPNCQRKLRITCRCGRSFNRATVLFDSPETFTRKNDLLLACPHCRQA